MDAMVGPDYDRGRPVRRAANQIGPSGQCCGGALDHDSAAQDLDGFDDRLIMRSFGCGAMQKYRTRPPNGSSGERPFTWSAVLIIIITQQRDGGAAPCGVSKPFEIADAGC
jgi:hypothetical protein